MGVFREKVRLVGQFGILAQDNFFPSRFVGQFFFEKLSYWTDSSVFYLYFYILTKSSP